MIIPIIPSIACAHAPIPGDSCAYDLASLSGPDNARYHVDVACQYFEEQTGHSPDLSGVSIAIEQGRSYALLQAEPEIYVNHRSDIWERELHHEVWHVLLWRAEPEIDPRIHHSAMLSRRLCIPIDICGYPRFDQNW